MRTNFIKILGIIWLGFFFGCSNEDGSGIDDPFNNCIEGAGGLVSQVRDLPIFSTIESSLVGDIILEKAPEFNIRLEAQQNILDLINTQVINEKLLIDVEKCFNNTIGITVYIQMPELTEISLCGVGNINFENDFNPDQLDVNHEGVGNISLRGSTNTLNIDITGVGDVKAFDMPTGSCTVNIIGEGTAEVFVSNQLNISIEGAGTVFYKGNPTITTDINGSGEVINAN